MDADRNCTATFATQTRDLSVQIFGDGQGTVVSSPSGISCPGDCSGEFELGSVITLNPTPAAGSVFSSFSGSADCADGSITVNSNTACVAVFSLEAPVLFEDDFEYGDTLEWSSEVP